MRYKLRATKIELLKFIASRKIIVSYDLMHAFGYSHDRAISAIRRLRREYLIEGERSPDGKVKNWWPTEIGRNRLIYLIDRYEGGVAYGY